MGNARASDGTADEIDIKDSDRRGIARDNAGGTGDKTDEMDTVDSDRRGTPKRKGGILGDVIEAIESDRIGAALPKLGKEITDKLESCRDRGTVSFSSLAKTIWLPI